MSGRSRSSTLYLKKLEKLEICSCEELESIIGGATDEEESLTSSTSPLPPDDAFSQLQSIKIESCPKMKNVVGPELLPLLHNLRRIRVNEASNMEEIIAVPSPTSIPAATFPLQLPLLTSISVLGCSEMKRVLTLELFMFLPNLQTIHVHDCKEMKDVIGGQELDHGATSSLFLSPITAASPGIQLSTRKLTLNLSDLKELESICSWTRLRDLIHVIYISRCPKLKRIEMLDDASPPPALK
ncbi:hypothetical protein CDL15_Pgr013807 [Punica granatum]|uniref:Disease resistance protein At4g27190-like leucine-rich repeats domain-containing protein n=1 Tax=Punica granatum TaxID=22663 RepID=A0A218W2Q7_PUNGR|nr:hypothetical protein CDL15_Pgr013807 [Punica granatum]PKI64294.1 hypothetical protein CRG98_015301 [Punica granatum]